MKAYIANQKAGSPTDPSVYWIHLKPKEIRDSLYELHGFKLGESVIKRVLLEEGYGYRKMSKTIPIGSYAQRNKQFEIIFKLVQIMSIKSPIISIDCKKKERIGNLYRDGKCYCTKSLKVCDHDYSNLSKGKVVPHGIYDLHLNKGYVSIGNSHETAEFIADNILWWWDKYGKDNYPDAQQILVLCDSGGGNSYRHHAFKKEIQGLAKETGIDFIICHYPPYSSKWNPIEHRLFSHMHRAMEGVIFNDYTIIKSLIEKTNTAQGLSTVARFNFKNYKTGIKTKKEEIDYSKILFNKQIPELSYRIVA